MSMEDTSTYVTVLTNPRLQYFVTDLFDVSTRLRKLHSSSTNIYI
jgi:hypothetical protein